jgi:hypothetical protein
VKQGSPNGEDFLAYVTSRDFEVAQNSDDADIRGWATIVVFAVGMAGGGHRRRFPRVLERQRPRARVDRHLRRVVAQALSSLQLEKRSQSRKGRLVLIQRQVARASNTREVKAGTGSMSPSEEFESWTQPTSHGRLLRS